MAVSDIDELDGYDPTTPHKPPPTAKKRAGASKPPSSKPTSSQARAGPSGAKPASRAVARKASSKISVVELGKEEEEAEDIAPVVRDDFPRSRSTTETTTTNGTAKGTTRTKGKEKDKVEVHSKRATSPVIIDESSDNERREKRNGAARGNRTGRSPSPAATVPSMRELERLRKQLQEVTSQRDDALKQAEELIDLRHTDAEKELKSATEAFEAALETKERLLRTTVDELARYQPLLAAGNTTMIHFLTREAADVEKAKLQEEADRAKQLVFERDERIKELEAELASVKQERDYEIKRARDLQAAATRGGNAGRVLAAGKNGDDPLKGQTILLYESITNLLVLNVKVEKGVHPEKPDCCFSCVYTCAPYSVSFLLESTWEASSEPPGLICMDKYSPQNLDKETDEFKQRLDYLSGTITFDHDQVNIMFADLQRFLTDEVSPTDPSQAQEAIVVDDE